MRNARDNAKERGLVEVNPGLMERVRANIRDE